MTQQRPQHPKTIHGRGVTQREFRDAIAAEVRRLISVKPRDILPALGPEWKETQSGMRLVAQTMSNMVTSRWLVKDSNGFYSLSPAYDTRRGRVLEDQILKVVRAAGGVMHLSQILEAFDARPSKASDARHGGSTRNVADYTQIRREVHASKSLVVYYKRGVYGLTWNELSAEPLTGHWAKFFILEGLAGRKMHGMSARETELTLSRKVFDHYEHVSACFKDLRMEHGEDIADLMGDPAVRQATADLKLSAKTVVTQIYEEIRANATAESERVRPELEGIQRAQHIESIRDRETPKVLQFLYVHFEQGCPVTHDAANADFYRAVAAHYGVCPAALSRGMILTKAKPLDADKEGDGGEGGDIEITVPSLAAVNDDRFPERRVVRA